MYAFIIKHKVSQNLNWKLYFEFLLVLLSVVFAFSSWTNFMLGVS